MEISHDVAVGGGRLKGFLDRIFPERQLLLKTDGHVRFVRLPRWVQMCAVVTVVAILSWTVSWTTYTVIAMHDHDRTIDGKDVEIANTRLAYRSLLNEVGEYQKKFVAITQDLEKNHGLMVGLMRENATLQENLKSIENQLKSTELEREAMVGAREHLKGELHDVQDKMQALISRNFSLRDNLNTVESDLQSALSDRNRAMLDGDKMRRKLNDLEKRLAHLQETELDMVRRFADRTDQQIERLEKVIELAGLTAEKVLDADDSLPTGQGGPFISVQPASGPAEGLRTGLGELEARLNYSAALQSVMSKMPLTAPLNSYTITSRFGKRRDPINRKWAMRYGLDMGAVFRTSICVPAPGVVTFAGWKGRYGRLIEVDHGAGITTRYGHLHKILVKKGQKLNFRDKIGLVGSTGRSTGAHLHYEITFQGKPLNPMKFLEAGGYVFQG